MTTNAAETPAQARCPYCHFDHNGCTKFMDIVNGYLVIDPESSQLINREDWDYDNDMESDYSMSSHINYCYMCGRRLDEDD